MVYLIALRKYALLFLKTVIFFALGLMLYLLTLLVFLKFKGDSSILLQALKNYGLFIVYSFPIMILVASSFYFGFIGNDKLFILRMIPIIAGFNTIILFVFFLIKIDFSGLPKPEQLYFHPAIDAGYINTIGEYKVYLEKGSNRGILFYKNAYLIDGWSAGQNTANVSAYMVLTGNGLSKQNVSFSIPRKEPVMQLQETGIARFMMNYYISYLKKLREIFHSTFINGGPISSLLAIFFMVTGFFSIVCGLASFFSDKQIMIMNYATLFAIATILFVLFPNFLSLVILIKFGIKIGFFRVVLPGLFVGLFGSLIGYGLLELRLLILKQGTAAKTR